MLWILWRLNERISYLGSAWHPVPTSGSFSCLITYIVYHSSAYLFSSSFYWHLQKKGQIVLPNVFEVEHHVNCGHGKGVVGEEKEGRLVEEEVVGHVLIQVEDKTVHRDVDWEPLIIVQSEASSIDGSAHIPPPRTRVDHLRLFNALLGRSRVVKSFSFNAILESLACICSLAPPGCLEWCMILIILTSCSGQTRCSYSGWHFSSQESCTCKGRGSPTSVFEIHFQKSRNHHHACI